MAKQSPAASSQSEEEGLLVPLKLVEGINNTADIQSSRPLGVVPIVNDSCDQ